MKLRSKRPVPKSNRKRTAILTGKPLRNAGVKTLGFLRLHARFTNQESETALAEPQGKRVSFLLYPVNSVLATSYESGAAVRFIAHAQESLQNTAYG